MTTIASGSLVCRSPQGNLRHQKATPKAVFSAEQSSYAGQSPQSSPQSSPPLRAAGVQLQCSGFPEQIRMDPVPTAATTSPLPLSTGVLKEVDRRPPHTVWDTLKGVVARPVGRRSTVPKGGPHQHDPPHTPARRAAGVQHLSRPEQIRMGPHPAPTAAAAAPQEQPPPSPAPSAAPPTFCWLNSRRLKKVARPVGRRSVSEGSHQRPPDTPPPPARPTSARRPTSTLRSMVARRWSPTMLSSGRRGRTTRDASAPVSPDFRAEDCRAEEDCHRGGPIVLPRWSPRRKPPAPADTSQKSTRR